MMGNSFSLLTMLLSHPFCHVPFYDTLEVSFCRFLYVTNENQNTSLFKFSSNIMAGLSDGHGCPAGYF
jgi:hypothetical protein